MKLSTLKFNWENAFLSLLWALCLMLMTAFAFFIFTDKTTKGYSLGKDNSSLTITKEIMWDEDDQILLDRNITFSEAVRLVDSLNNTLKK